MDKTMQKTNNFGAMKNLHLRELFSVHDTFNWRYHLFYTSCFRAVTYCLRALSLFLSCIFALLSPSPEPKGYKT